MSSQGQRGQRSGSPAPPQVLKWTASMDEAYEAAVEKMGGLDQCKPKAVLQQLQADHPDLFADMDIQRVKWKLLSHRRREMRHRAMAPQGIAPPTKWSGRLEEAYEAAVAQLGGIHSAQPKQLLERLQPQFPDLTLEVIKWHLQGQRRRERRLTGRSSSTQHSPRQQQQRQQQQEQQEEQQEVGEEQEEMTEGERGRAQAQRPKQQRQQPARRRRRAASATPEAEGTAMSAAGAPDGEQEAANAQPREQQQQQRQQQQPQEEQLPPPSWLQQPLAAQWTVEQQVVQQGIAQQLGQVPAAQPLLQQGQPQLPHLPPLPGATLLPDALLVGPSAPRGLVAGSSTSALLQHSVAGGPDWAQHMLPAAFQALSKVRRSRLIAAQLVTLLEEQRAKLVRLVPTLVAAEAAQAPSSHTSGASVDPLSQLLQTAQLLPAGQPWPALAGASSMLPPAAARDISPVPHKRQLHGVLAAAAALPLCSASAAVGPLQSGGGGSRSSGESGEEHLLTCTIPNCRRCAYERRLQASKQQQGAGALGQQQQAQQQRQAQQAQQQQQAVELAASIGSEPLPDFRDPALVRLLGSMLGSMPPE